MTSIDQIDVRSSLERLLGGTVDPDEFSELEMNMIDIAAVHVFKRARRGLPSELIDFTRDGDPAGLIRQWAYQWAHEHPHEVHDRTPGQIVKHVRRRLRQDLGRYLEKRKREVPGGFNLEAHLRGVDVIADEKREKERDIFTTTRPVKRPQPMKYKGEATRLRGERDAEAIGNLGVIPDPDKWQFALTGKTLSPFDDGRGEYVQADGKSVFTVPDRFTWEDREKFAKLHTRRPTRSEYWAEVLDGNSHRTARKDLADDTELHADTIAAIVEDVAPAVSERFSTGPRPVDGEDVDRKRLRLVSEEVQRVLLEKFDVLYEE